MSARLRSLVRPLTPLYRLALSLRERRLESGREPVRRLQFPVISIGNLSTGGAGKTPLTIALAQALTARGLAVDVLSRGYGRRSTVPARVNPDGSPDDYGDEPLLIARAANVPVYVAPQRYDAGLLAESQLAPSQPTELPLTSFVSGHDFSRAEESTKEKPGFSPCPLQLHLLDDGFQHRQLHRDVDLLLLSECDLHDRLLPAGNLREPLESLQRASALLIAENDYATANYVNQILPIDRNSEQPRWIGPIWRIHRRMQVPPNLAGNPVLAFCGIARPEQFFTGLSEAGLTLAARAAFRDHHRYTARDLQTLAAKARAAGAAILLTTEKDAVRLAHLEQPLPILAVPLRAEIEDTPAVLDWLLNRLDQTR
jgi:tetraacyldisaccharide 4'-kinase